MSRIGFAIMTALILAIGTLALTPSVKAQTYGATSEHQQAQDNEQNALTRRGS